jgi:hypothetical protein
LIGKGSLELTDRAFHPRLAPLYWSTGVIYDILCFASFYTALTAYRRVRVAPQLKREIGIQAARTIFGKCFFDAEKCADGIQALRHYRYEADEAHLDPSGKPGLRKEPLHDWASHAADAFRTAAVMIREPERKKEQEKRRPAGKLSPWS